MTKHKSEDYKISAVQYYLEHNKSQINTCKIFKCTPRSLMRWVIDILLKNKLKEMIENQYHIKFVKYMLNF